MDPYFVHTQGFIQDFLLGGDFVMLGTLGACPIEIMSLEIIRECASTLY